MTIEVLYPEICNLFGDSGNMKYLKKCLPDAKWVETGFSQTPAFVNEDVDLIYMGPMSEKTQENVTERLMPHRERLGELMAKGKCFLMTGNAAEVFGKEVKDKDGTGFKGLGLIDMTADRDMFGRRNNIYLGMFGDIEVIGFQTQFTVAHLGGSEKGLFKNVIGMGQYPGATEEGVRKNNFFGTYLVGPILVMNPPFTKKLLEAMGVKEPKLALEEETMEAYKNRVIDFKQVKNP